VFEKGQRVRVRAAGVPDFATVRFALPGDRPGSWDLILVDDDRRHEVNLAPGDTETVRALLSDGRADSARVLAGMWTRWMDAADANPDVADDIYFVPALKGPKTALAAQHVMYNWIVPSHARNVDAAKEFLLHYTGNWPLVTYHSKLYDLPAFPKLVPQLNGWLDKDPFGAKPENKLAVLKNAIDWSTNIGHPGPANTAIGEVFATFVIPNMFAKAARGELSPQQAVADAERQIKPIFDKWRRRGLVGGA
jgi:ABC-type glycerol-3-phosphate transport system substrate-binding protein